MSERKSFHEIETSHVFVFHSVRERALWAGRARPLDSLCPERFRAVTLVVAFDAAGRPAVGEATCSAKDQFNKKLGRTIAEGRAMKLLAAYPKQLPGAPLPRKEAMAFAVRVVIDRLRELGGTKGREAGA